MPLKTYKRQVNKDPKRDGPHARWSEKQKYEAVALYKMVGNLRAVGQTLGIPEETMRNWHQSEWWKVVEDEIATEARVKRTKRLDKLVDLATDIVEDRLQNGDWIYNAQTGDLRRKPVNALTASRILSTTVDKQVLLENLAKDAKKIETAEKIQDRLEFLWHEMTRFARAKDVSADSTRVREGGDPHLLGESDAIQIESATEMDVLSETDDGEEVGKGNTEHEVASEKGQEG